MSQMSGHMYTEPPSQIIAIIQLLGWGMLLPVSWGFLVGTRTSRTGGSYILFYFAPVAVMILLTIFLISHELRYGAGSILDALFSMEHDVWPRFMRVGGILAYPLSAVIWALTCREWEQRS